MEEEYKKVDVICHSYQAIEEKNFRNSGQDIIHLWCFDKETTPIRLRIQNFNNFFHVELPLYIDGRPVIWDNIMADLFVQILSRMLKNDAPVSWSLTYKQKLYYYRGNRTYPMLMLFFKTNNAMRHCENLVKKPNKYDTLGTMSLKCHEGNINSLRKLFTLVNCKYAQWFQITGLEIPVDTDERLSVDGFSLKPIKEYIADWQTIIPISFDISESWSSKPTLFGIDIETYSDNHLAMPDPFNPLHKAYMCSCIYQRLGDKSTRQKFGIIIGECDSIPGCEVICVNNELELVKALADLTNRLDPDIFTGYNIFSYDYNYLDVRIKSKLEDWPVMGRTLGKMSDIYSKTWKSSAYGFNSLNVLLMDGRISIDMLPIIRRGTKLDKYTLDFVCKHFLGVGKHDISAQEMFKIYDTLQKSKDNYNELPTDLNKEIYSKAVTDMTRVMAYCIQDSELVIDLFEQQKVWTDLLELSNVVGVSIMDLFTSGQQIRCVSQLYDKAYNKNRVLDTRKIPKMFFNGGYVFEPIPGLYENILCLDFASLYPSIMEAYNICFTTLIPPELMDDIPDDECNVIEFDQEEPISGINEGSEEEEDDIIPGVNDEEPEEPLSTEEIEEKKKIKTIKRHYKFKFTKKIVGLLPELVHDLVAERNAVKGKMKQIKIKMDGLILVKITDTKETIQEKINLLKSIINPTNKEKNMLNILSKSILPNLEKIILPLIKETPDINQKLLELEILENVLDKRQLALKVSANSMFGFLGAQNGGMFPLIEAAMSVTAKGRELINGVNKYLVDTYNAKIIYGDTDSSMVDLNITDSKLCDSWGKKLVDEISGVPEKKLADGTIIPAKKGLFPPPLRVEFEKAMRLLCICPKKYAALLINEEGQFEKDNNGKHKILKRGIVLARRDNCAYLRLCYTELLHIILERKDIIIAMNSIINTSINLLKGKIPIKGNLSIIRELGSNYKSDNFFMKVFSDELRKIGKPANPGDRLEYFIVKTKEEIESEIDKYQVINNQTVIIPAKPIKIALGLKMRLLENYIENNNNEIVDYLYYLEHMLMNPIDQLFGVAYNKELALLKNIGYTPQHSRCHFSSIITPIQMLSKLINDYKKAGYNLKSIADYIETSIIPWFINERAQITSK